MKKYENYKDSGLEWLGMVPEHWEIMRLKSCSSIILGKMLMSIPPKGQEANYSLEKYLKSKNVGWLNLCLDDNAVEEMFFNETEKELYKLREGDIVMNEGGDIGKVALWHDTGYDCYIQNSINKITSSNGVIPAFLTYYLYSVSMSGYFWSIVSQISIAHLTKEKLANTPIILPPLTEQRTIASYLDRKVGQIDALISEKGKMVEDLKAYRSSLITETVTKGLDKEVEMKDSGVEWIGKMPKDWKLLKLKRIVNLKSGTTLTSDRILDEGKYQVFGGNGPRGYIDDYTNEGNFVLIGRQGALCGNINYANGKFWATEHAIICYPLKDIDTIWLGETLRAMNLNQYSISAAQPGLAVERINELLIPTPSISEQKEISSYLKLRIIQIESAISEQEHQLSDLKSYKSSLITEAVTGKIDLRDWQTKNHNALWQEYRTKHIWKSTS